MATRSKAVIDADRHASCTITESKDGKQVRAERQKAVQKAMNDKRARKHFELQIAHNFNKDDIFFTLTYRDGFYPRCRAGSIFNMKELVMTLRAHRHAKSQILKYIYTTGKKPGDVRYQHHIIINDTGENIEIIRSLWGHGDVINVARLGERSWGEWVKIMTKGSGDRAVGARMWIGSMNLVREREI